MSKIAYSAVVIDDRSRYRLIQKFKDIIPTEFEIVAHHMTINQGEIDPDYADYLGMTIRLTINDIAMNDMVIALGVTGFYSENPKPHLTLAVNRDEGGKPMMSRDLTNWEKLKRPFYITGRISEVGHNADIW